MTIYLIDMDNTIADLQGGFAIEWARRHPERTPFKKGDQDKFILEDCFPENDASYVSEILYGPGFMRKLPVIEGAVEALRDLDNIGDVVICTTPFDEYKNCIAEKYHWVEEHFGKDWVKKVMPADDKTLVRGDILIDDKPHIRGKLKPSWKHILYTQRWNKCMTKKKRLTWQDYRHVL